MLHHLETSRCVSLHKTIHLCHCINWKCCRLLLHATTATCRRLDRDFSTRTYCLHVVNENRHMDCIATGPTHENPCQALRMHTRGSETVHLRIFEEPRPYSIRYTCQWSFTVYNAIKVPLIVACSAHAVNDWSTQPVARRTGPHTFNVRVLENIVTYRA